MTVVAAVTQFRSDYVMARPEPTDLRARHSLLSGDHSSPVGTEGHNKLESFDIGA